MKAANILIPIKFFLIMIQFILSIVADHTKGNNINSKIEFFKQSELIDYDLENAHLVRIFIVFYVFQSVNLVITLSSYTMFYNKLNFLSIIFLFVSNLCLAWFIWQSWISDKLIISLIIGSILPFVLECLTILHIVIIKRHNTEFKFFY